MLNSLIITAGALVTCFALAGAHGLGVLWSLIVLAPYLALGILALLVYGGGASTFARQASLVDSILVVGISAFFYLPVPGGCMGSMVFLLAIPLLVAVPIVFGLLFWLLQFLDKDPG